MDNTKKIEEGVNLDKIGLEQYKDYTSDLNNEKSRIEDIIKKNTQDIIEEKSK
jgi:hypothetical protein